MSKNWIYHHSANDRYRYSLGVEGKKPLICIGVNPSAAKPGQLFPTLSSVARMAERHDFDGWLMLNLYPQRAVNPNDLHQRFQQKEHEENLKVIEHLLQAEENHIWVAWGTLIEKRDYLPKALADIYELSKKYPTSWHCIGKKTKFGHPHHPLYLRKDSPIETFDIEGYLRKF
jgi:hypothetical protein